MSTRLKIVLFFLLLVVPGLLTASTAVVAVKRAETLEFCSSCHTMDPWVENVTGEDSDSLASEHYKNRWIQSDQCYTCHTNYGLFGPVQAKIKGVRHVIAYYIGDTSNIKLYDPFPNENCLHCHLEAKGFRENSNHDPIADILSGEDRCVDCHENVHGVEQHGGEAAEAADAKDEGEAKADDKAADPAKADDASKEGAKAGDDKGEAE